MSITPTDAEILTEAIESKLLDVHTALPGVIQKYDATTQTADIQIQLKRVLLNDNEELVSEDLPVLPNVPIAFPRSSNFFISFPLAAGDFVFVIFSELSLDVWRSKGSLCSPGDARRHSLTGGVAIPCLYPNSVALSNAHASDMVLGEDGVDNNRVHIKSGGAVEVTSNATALADDFVAMAAKVLTELEKVESAFNGHVHMTAGTGTPSPPVDPTPPNDPKVIVIADSVASSNLKADN